MLIQSYTFIILDMQVVSFTHAHTYALNSHIRFIGLHSHIYTHTYYALSVPHTHILNKMLHYKIALFTHCKVSI